KKALKENRWISKEKERLVALGGGTETKGGKIVLKDTDIDIGKSVVSEYSQRVGLKAERVERGPLYQRIARGAVSTVTGRETKPTQYRKRLAIEVRNAAKGKTADQQLADILKQRRKENPDFAKDVETETTTQAPVPETASEPTPTQDNTGGGTTT
ncbi:MAG: hypothetical protein WAZ44_03305, partial [Minisyncoccia bacterium]